MGSAQVSGSDDGDSQHQPTLAAGGNRASLDSMSFDSYHLPDEYQELRSAIRALADAQIAPHAAETDEKAEFPQAAYEALVKSDFHAMHVPSEYGGAGGDALAVAIVIEEVARACASSSLIPSVNKLGSLSVITHGTQAQKERWLPPLARGEVMWSYALSEAEAGSDIASMKTRAVRDGDSWILKGAKRWITNAGVSDYYTVFATVDPALGGKGITTFLVEKSDPGLSFGAPEKKLGIKGSPTREVYLDNVRLSDDRLIGRVGDGMSIALGTLDHTRVTIAAQALGIAQGALDAAVAYVKERRQFGQAIAEFQGIQFMLADMAMQIEAARALTYRAASASERNESDLTFLGAACKCFASDVAMKVTTDAVQLLGGYGYTHDYPVERMMRDAKITQIYEGTNQIQRVVMSRKLLA